MPGTVTSELTNVTLAEAADDTLWDDIGGGQGSAQNGDLPIEGSATRARRIDNTTDRGFSFDNTSTIDLSTAGTHITWWLNILQPGQVTVASLILGGASTPISSPWSEWDAFASAGIPYPPRGGWQRIWLDPTRARDDGAGTLDLSAIRQFGLRCSMGDVGGNALNVHLDRIDYSTGGLLIDAGTVPSPAVFDNLVTNDSSNAYGVVLEQDGIIFCLARITIADATATIFNDSGFVIAYADQALVADDFMGITVDLQNGSTDIDWADGIVRSGGSTNKGDLRVLDTTGAFDLDNCTFDNLRRILWTGGVTAAACTINASGQIDPTNGDYSGSLDLPGTDEYVDTQESLDVSSSSGDFEIFMRITPADWTPSSIEALMSHYSGTSTLESFRFQLLTTGALRLIISDGTTETTLDSNVLSLSVQLDTSPVQGNSLWVRVQYDQSAGQANFFESVDGTDTTPGDISWTAAGTPSGTSRSMPSTTRPILIGAENDSTPTAFFDGSVEYAELWIDGFQAVGSGHGNLFFRADWRTGPAFSGSPSTRADDFDGSGITWELQGTAPAYTAGGNETTAADLDGCKVSNSASESALVWNVNTDPDGELDNMEFISSGTGHAIEFGPNTPSTITLTGHNYSGYAGSDGSTGDETIYNNTGGSLTINVVGGGDTPTVRNGTGASTTVNNNVTVTLTGMKDNTEVRIFEAGTLVVVDGTENATDGSPDNRSFSFSDSATDVVDIRIFNVDFEPADILGFSIPATATSIPIQQKIDRSFSNP